MAGQELIKETAVAVVGKLRSGEVSPLDLLENTPEKSKQFQAIELLDSLLVNGPVPVTEIRDAARRHHHLFGASPQLRDGLCDARLKQAAPGRRFALLCPLRIQCDERHQRREPVAMIDVIAVFEARTAQIYRGIEVVRVGIELIEQIE